MKKIALLTFLSVSSIIAQDGIKFEVEPTIGYNKFDGDSKMKDSFMYGLRGTAYINCYYAYRLNYQRSDDVHYKNNSSSTSTIADSTKVKTTDVQRVSAQLLMSGEEDYHVIPYILLGLGYESLSDETKYDVSQTYVEAGVGFKHNWLNNLYATLEGNVLRKFDTKDIDYGVTFGVGYMFGEKDDNRVEEYKPTTFMNSTPEPIVESTRTYKVPASSGVSTKPVIAPISKYSFEEESSASVSPTTYSSSEPVSSFIENASYDVVDNSINENSYYIQVAAWFKSEDPRLLTKLDNSGLAYEVANEVRKGRDAKIVKVGPYLSYADAKADLKTVKRIKRDSYITK